MVTELPSSIDIIIVEWFRERGALFIQGSLGCTADLYADHFGLDSSLDESKIRGMNLHHFQDGFLFNVGF